MTEKDIQNIRDLAEHTVVQLKERLTRECRQEVAEEMVCMSNSRGGIIVIGINDKTGIINPLTFEELQETNTALSALANDNVVPSINLTTENVKVKGGAVVVATIQKGVNIPYRDNKGVIWVKNAGNKKRVTSNDEIAMMMAEGGSFHPDMATIRGCGISDLDESMLKRYLLNRFSSKSRQLGIDGEIALGMSADELALKLLGDIKCEQLLKNLGLLSDDGNMTIAGLMLFGKYPQKWLPTFTVRCVSFVGNDPAVSVFRDKSDASADGNLFHIYEYVMAFIHRNLKNIQKEPEFNTPGELEIPEGALTEVVTNALIHRSYIRKAPVRVFIFDDRIEIHSPGLLPDGIDVETLKMGTSRPVNELLFNHAIHMLPYTGVGTGIIRAMSLEKNMKMVNDEKLQEFVVVFSRNQVEKPMDNGRDSGGDSGRDGRDKGVSNNKLSRTPYKDLPSQWKNVIQYCSIPRTSREIIGHLGYSYNAKYIKEIIRPLVEMQYLEMLFPDKPNSRNQKYRKVESTVKREN